MNLVTDALAKHSDEEIIAYLSSVMTGVVKNYQTALKTNQPEILWGSLGDLSQVKSFLSAMKKRNDERAAQANM